MRALIIVAAASLSGCASVPVPIDRPCGVIVDSLRDVRGATPSDTRRIDIHFERGVAANCWKRS
jgi:starvation-inducible outer membrane lipoprotein